MSIKVGSSVPPGDYKIKLEGEGSDGKKNWCTYKLIIIEKKSLEQDFHAGYT
jgi:hypothetical protein